MLATWASVCRKADGGRDKNNSKQQCDRLGVSLPHGHGVANCAHIKSRCSKSDCLLFQYRFVAPPLPHKARALRGPVCKSNRPRQRGPGCGALSAPATATLLREALATNKKASAVRGVQLRTVLKFVLIARCIAPQDAIKESE